MADDPAETDVADKGEMVFVYRSDLQEFFLWVADQGLDHETMNERQAEAFSALQADAED